MTCPRWLDRTALAIIAMSVPFALYLWVSL
jgi:hypothetical protein